MPRKQEGNSKNLYRVRIVFAAIFGLVACEIVTAQGRVWYVNSAAEGANDGGNWPNAFNDLHDALGVAQDDDEIWVAAGTYSPDRGTGDFNAYFSLVGGVALYGGFSGWETNREQRDWTKNETILSGDLYGDDGPEGCDQLSDCCRPHEGFGCDDQRCEDLVCAELPDCCGDGFGYLKSWDGNCARMAALLCCQLGTSSTCENSNALLVGIDLHLRTTIDGFIVERTYASSDRGSFNPNEAGGLFAERSSLAVRNCTFRHHVGIALSASQKQQEIELSNCVFSNNPRFSVSVGQEAITLIRDCRFNQNSEGLSVGGNTTLLRTVFADNDFHTFRASGNLTVRDCRFTGNGPPFAFDFSSGIADVRNCLFDGNGAGATVYFASARFTNCAFIGQQASIGGLSSSNAQIVMNNCLIAGNHLALGIWHQSGALELMNSTIAYNELRGIFLDYGVTSARINNTVLWNNSRYFSKVKSEEDQLGISSLVPLDRITINNSILGGWTGRFGGEGNSGDNPMFVNPLGADGVTGTLDDDLRVLWGSPAIDAGAFIGGLPATDLDGHARVLCGFPDIGAYEFGIGDYDCNGTVDLLDFSAWPECMTGPGLGPHAPDCIPFDFNANQTIDMFDFSQFSRAVRPPPKMPQPLHFRDRFHRR